MKVKLLRKWRSNFRIENVDPEMGKESTNWILKAWDYRGFPVIFKSGTFTECLEQEHTYLRDFVKNYEERSMKRFYTRL